MSHNVNETGSEILPGFVCEMSNEIVSRICNIIFSMCLTLICRGYVVWNISSIFTSSLLDVPLWELFIGHASEI